ncbi:MAG: hypothetical protein AB7O54_08400 [Pseudomonadales bacterium]
MDGFGSYYGETNLHPLGLIVVVSLGLTMLIVKRRYALIPLLVVACTIPVSQRLVILGSDFTLLRILLLIAISRMIFDSSLKNGFRWNRLDTAILLWTLSGTIVMTANIGSLGALVNRLGWSFDILASYFLVRMLVKERSDVLVIAKATAILSLPVAVAFAVEWTTRYNMFSIFGGVPAETVIREGRFRCQGAFMHPILAGTFWVCAMPLFWMLRGESDSYRRWSRMGFIASLFIVIACASSTPLLSLAVGLLGWYLFRYREYRKHLRYGFVFGLIGLHIVMNNPVWHLMARVDILGGSTGWHRYRIFDTFVNHFSDWFLLGEANPMSWGVWEMRDITNEYMLQGLRGGLLTLTLFVFVLAFAFGNVGRVLNLLGTQRAPQSHEWLTWLIGVALLIHTVTFMGVSYFGQMHLILYIQLALAGCVSHPAFHRNASFRSPMRAEAKVLGQSAIRKGA